MLILITGASSGLGKELASTLAKEGHFLILVARDLSSIDLPALLFPCDLSCPEDRKRCLALIQEKTPDLVINNAGFGLYGEILSHPLDAYQNMMSLNATAVMEISIEAARALASSNKKGTILNISSAAAFFPYPTFTVYAATKAFINSFSQGFDEEMRPRGIRILTVCPGQIDTPFRKKAAQGTPQKSDSYTFSTKKAVRLILKQLKTQKRLNIIDFRYKIGVFAAKIAPYKALFFLLCNNLKERYNSTKR
ncbi:MAG: hypothetical protein RLZZ453_638 [Chlamydiota bacterium]|jgi:short-subunit dehydrogenase